MKVIAFAAALTLAACTQDETAKPAPDARAGDAAPSVLTDGPAASPSAAIPDQFRALGTEPFWAAHFSEGQIRYSTPDNIGGVTFAAERMQDGDDVVVSGAMEDVGFALRIALGECSDGMSDRVYPFRARLTVGDEQREGCARPIDG